MLTNIWFNNSLDSNYFIILIRCQVLSYHLFDPTCIPILFSRRGFSVDDSPFKGVILSRAAAVGKFSLVEVLVLLLFSNAMDSFCPSFSCLVGILWIASSESLCFATVFDERLLCCKDVSELSDLVATEVLLEVLWSLFDTGIFCFTSSSFKANLKLKKHF